MLRVPELRLQRTSCSQYRDWRNEERGSKERTVMKMSLRSTPELAIAGAISFWLP